MKISEGALDLGSTDYAVALDPTYTMLEFDSLRVLPVDSGLCCMTTSTLHCGVKCTRIASNDRTTGTKCFRFVPIQENDPDDVGSP